jgi:hypothetical protein
MSTKGPYFWVSFTNYHHVITFLPPHAKIHCTTAHCHQNRKKQDEDQSQEKKRERSIEKQVTYDGGE